MLWLLRTVVWTVGLVLCGVVAAEEAQDNSIENLLVKAEALRIKSPSEVTRLLAEIEADGHLLSEQQQHRVILLKAHQQALKGLFDAANNRLERLLMEPLHPSQRVRALYLLAQIAEIQTNYEDAFLYLNRAIQLPTAEQSIEARHDILFLAANLFSRAGDFKGASVYGRQALELAQAHPELKLVCTSWQNIGQIHTDGNELKLAERAIMKQIEICQSDEEPLVTADGELRMGMLEQQRNRFKKSLVWLEKAYDKFVNIDYVTGIINTKVAMADSWYQLGELETANRLVNEAIGPALGQKQWQDLQLAYQLSAQIAESRGQYQLAMELYKKHLTAAANVTNNNKTLRLAYLQIQFEVERSKQQMSLNETQQRYHQLQQKSNYQHLWIVGLSSGLLLSLCLAAVMYFGRLRRQQRHYRDQSQLDPLTGVYNRKQCYEMALEMYEQSCLDHSSFIVVKADIDSFKEVNVRHGYDVGDIALQALAGRLQQATRDGDILGRVGGDEFILFFSNITVYQVMNIVQRCQSLLAELVIDNKAVKMTVSFGLAEADGLVTDSSVGSAPKAELEKLIQHASMALASAHQDNGSGLMMYRDLPYNTPPGQFDDPHKPGDRDSELSDKTPLGA